MKYNLSGVLTSMVGQHPALLRYKNENNFESKLVEITDHKLCTLICCLKEGEVLPSEFRNITLIIKNNEHYLHCNGNVGRSFLNGRLFTMELIKASLFIRIKENDSSWLQQLYKYDRMIS